MPVAALSYGAGACAFVALAVLGLTRWRDRIGGGGFVLASTATALWCLIAAGSALGEVVALRWTFLAEALRTGVWLSLMLTLLNAGRAPGERTPQRARVAVACVWIGALLLVALETMFGYMLWMQRAYYVSGLLMAATGVLLVEQLYRNSEAPERFAVKHLCLGLGAVFAFDLYLYAEGVLLKSLSAELFSARGAVWGLIVPLLAVSASRVPDGQGSLRISRRLAFYTTSLAAVGCYLLAMAAGGYYLRSVGGSWGAVAQVVFLVGALLALAVALFSAQVRGRLRVFLSKHFYTYKYDYREEWLRVIRLLFVPEDDTPVRLRALRAVAQIMDSPNAGLWMRRDLEGGDYEPSGGDFAGRDSPAIAADSPLAAFLRDEEWIIDLTDYRAGGADGRFRQFALPSWLVEETRAWLVVPLLHGNSLLGIIVLAHPRAHHPLTWEDLDLLKTVGRQVAGVLAEQITAQRVAEAGQFDAYNRLSAFIMHDLKNLIAQQSLVVGNAARHKDNPAFVEDAIQTVDHSVKRMARLLEQLQSGRATSTTSRINLADLCRKVVVDCRAAEAQLVLEVRDEGIYVEGAREQFGLVLGHVVRNALDAISPASGRVLVVVERRDGEGVIEVADNGVGMDEHFVRERLFKPFDTTKGNKGMGIGAYQAREFVRAAGGDVSVHSRPGEGTRFSIRLPLLHPPASADDADGASVAAGAPSSLDVSARTGALG